MLHTRQNHMYEPSSDDESDDDHRESNYDGPSTAGSYNDIHPPEDQPPEDQPSEDQPSEDIPPFPLGLKRQRAITLSPTLDGDLPPAPPHLMRQNAQAGGPLIIRMYRDFAGFPVRRGTIIEELDGSRRVA